MLAPQKLRILAFPQRIAGDQLEVNVLLLPTQRLLNFEQAFPSQLNPGNNVDLPDFIDATLRLEAKVIRGLSTYPFSDPTVLSNEGVTVQPLPTSAAFPGNLPTLYEGLRSQFQFDNSPIAKNEGAGTTWSPNRGIHKYLPRSYRSAFNFTNPRTEFAKTDDSYRCAVEDAPKPDPTFETRGPKITWGRVIAFCLRQPLLAEAIGLLHRLTLTLPSDDYFADGGWIYFDLLPPLTDFHINNPGELSRYAARIPRIDGPRQIFAALLFPVIPGPGVPAGEFDLLKIEAADYDDGFAKIVHANQPVSANLLAEEPDGIHVQKDAGIRLGWDDEQILIWQNRQVLADVVSGDRIDAPLGVFTYRVDVREKREPEADWTSLVLVRNKAELLLAGEAIAPAQRPIETGVQVFPTKLNAAASTFYWLPSFFTQWYGTSLVLPDTRAAELDKSGALTKPGEYFDSNITKKPEQVSNLYEPILPPDPELKYGKQYEFRVRFGDLTGGGPTAEERELNDAPASSASIIFKRYVAPKQLKVVPQAAQPVPDSPTNVFYEGTSFEISRPRLGYPALLFTEMDTNTAFTELKKDRDKLHTGKVGLETIKEQREVSYFDPDVDRILVAVEVKTLLGDNLNSLTQREAFIPLYFTFRDFDNDPKQPFALELNYRDANVIDFGNELNLGDLEISQAEIDAGPQLVLPRSRDIRITLWPVCSEKPASPEYFGFAKTNVSDERVFAGEPTQFFVREDADDEIDFFKPSLESTRLQAIYLQPDQPQVLNPDTVITEVVAGKELTQSTLIQRMASQLNLNFKGMTLMGNPGERIQFACGKRIRHTLAPDNSSITFSTKADLINHWLCVLSFEIDRDWTWRGLSDAGIEITRDKRFTGEAATAETEVVGYVQLKETANVVALKNAAKLKKPDRSYTRVVFIDAVEPKKPLGTPATQAKPFPNTIDLNYTLKPLFIDSVDPDAGDEQSVKSDVQLPVTTIPAQVPKVVAAGFALSPYQRDDIYSQTTTRKRYLWLEFAEPIADPNDNYFARVLTYAPDPLLSYPNLDQVAVKQEDLPLRTPVAPIRVITKGHGNDNAGLGDMQRMQAEVVDPGALIQISPVHYLLPLPEGLHEESNELFGFYTYELRVGHTEKIWSTAEGRWGHPVRLNGVQHPAPPLKCLVERTPKALSVTAHYATAVFNGRDVTSKPPKTEIWCMLYAQVKQADDVDYRNILLAEERMNYVNPEEKMKAIPFGVSKLILANSLMVNVDAPATAVARWTEQEIRTVLEQFNLVKNTKVSVLAVEMMPRYDQYIFHGPPNDQVVHPLSRQLGQYRILRTSRLVAAPEVC